MDSKRSSFTGKIGFVLAAAGSAVGLGNIWRFPYLAAKYGGGIFLLVYIALSLTFGFSLMIAEIAIGRKTQMSAIGAFKALDKRFSIVGWMAALVPAVILPYYSVIGGWVMKYIWGFVSGDAADMANASYFGDYIAKLGEPIFWFMLFITLTAIVVIFGVNKGVESVSKVMMPALVVLMVFIVIFTLCTGGKEIWSGVLHYIKPDFSKFTLMTVVAAAGQLFYSMSLAMGIMITFGSYSKKDISIPKSTKQIELFDMGIAFLAGLMIIPVVFANDPTSLGKSGPGLMFSVLPQIFAGSGEVVKTIPGGTFIGAVFFIMVFFAALTSSISLMETVVSIFMDRLNIGRKLSCVIIWGISVVLGLLSCLGYSSWDNVKIIGLQFLDFFDFVSNSLIMPIVAFLTCIFVGYFIKPKAIIEEVELNGKFGSKTLFTVVIKYVAPIVLLVILATSVVDVLSSSFNI